MNVIFATHFPSGIAAITEDGGDALLRDRVAALVHDERQLLRDALKRGEDRLVRLTTG
jgi:hypothetical protein